MSLRKTLAVLSGAAAILMSTAAIASAAEAYASTNVNMRSGPGTSYGVVNVLKRGELVDVRQCAGGWCLVTDYRSGGYGWVADSYLDRGYRPAPVVPVRPAPPVQFEFHFGTPPQPPRHWNDDRRPRPPQHRPGGYRDRHDGPGYGYRYDDDRRIPYNWY